MCFPGGGTHNTRDVCFPGRELKSLGICVFRVGEHITLGIRVSQLRELKSLGICFFQVGEHITLGICVSQVAELKSLGICVSQLGNT